MNISILLMEHDHSIVSYDLHGIFDRESWACKR